MTRQQDRPDLAAAILASQRAERADVGALARQEVGDIRSIPEMKAWLKGWDDACIAGFAE